MSSCGWPTWAAVFIQPCHSDDCALDQASANSAVCSAQVLVILIPPERCGRPGSGRPRCLYLPGFFSPSAGFFSPSALAAEALVEDPAELPHRRVHSFWESMERLMRSSQDPRDSFAMSCQVLNHSVDLVAEPAMDVAVSIQASQTFFCASEKEVRIV